LSAYSNFDDELRATSVPVDGLDFGLFFLLRDLTITVRLLSHADR
jgi:hypothetical protein